MSVLNFQSLRCLEEGRERPKEKVTGDLGWALVVRGVLRYLRQESQKFKATPGYLGPCLKKKKKKSQVSHMSPATRKQRANPMLQGM